jgi:hypothetical protein
MLVRVGQVIAPQNNLLPLVRETLLQFTMRHAEARSERLNCSSLIARPAEVTAHSHRLLYLVGQLIDVNFAIHFLTCLAIRLFMNVSSGLACLMCP